MDEQQRKELLEKYRNGLASALEKQQLHNWYRQVAVQESVFPDEEQEVEQRMLDRLNRAITPPRSRFRTLHWATAAAVLLFVSAAAWFLRPVTPQQQQTANHQPVTRIAPGSQKAVLTIAGGRQIVLNEAKNGIIMQEHNVAVTKTAEGHIAYSNVGSANGTVSMNILTTPRGGEYQVALPDGSHVWLNAATSLTYPSQFTGKERVVKLSGEAYFEVAKNPAKPFKVDVEGKQQVEVLGTHFNVNAYPDNNNISTTLLEGSVRLSAGNRVAYLKPGQTGINDLSGPFVVKPADVQEAMAWRNGLFVFHEENITEVLKTISRWYDVDVELKGNVKTKEFGGVTSRYKDLKEFLDVLKLSGGIQYKIEGRRVVIMD